MALHIGAIVRMVDTPDGQIARLVVMVTGVAGPTELGGAIPVDIANPVDVVTPAFIPSIQIVPEDHENDEGRLIGHGVAWRVPTDAARVAGPVTAASGATGYTEYETEIAPMPRKFRYTVMCNARSRSEINALARHVFRKMPRNFVLVVKDSLEQEREYSGLVTGEAQPSELTRILSREFAWSFSVEIQGELEYADAETFKSAYLPTRTITAT